MTMTLTNAKTEKLKLFCTNILNNRTSKLRTVASLSRKITSTFPAANFGRLHYRGLGRCKTIALCKSNGNFNARIHLTEVAKSDIRWWKENVSHLYNDIIVPNPDKCIARMWFRDKRDMTVGLWFFCMVVWNTFIRNTKKRSRLEVLEARNTHWKEIERVYISLHMWRIIIFSNYRSVCNKNHYTTENFCLL